jgi:hypothetical protein
MSAINDRRDMLIALLLSMSDKPPQPVDISAMGGQDKAFTLIACCLEMIAVSIRLTAASRDDAMLGADAAADDLRDRVNARFDRSPLN